jgi:hypothetical protein
MGLCRWSRVLGGSVLAVLIISLTATARYPGDRFALLLFLASFALLLISAVPSPRAYGYTFLVAFLFLGFPVKVLAYLVFGIVLLEPTGPFNGTARAWDSALLPATVGALGCATARALILLRARGSWTAGLKDPPLWYEVSRSRILLITATLAVLLNASNLAGAFYEIGLRPRVIFPAHLNVAVAWLLSTGMALWIAMIVGWDVRG